MKVYIVTAGCYSEKSIEAVFTSKKKANEYVKGFSKGWDGFNDIEKFEADPEFEIVKNKLYEVSMDKDGKVENAFVMNSRSGNIEDCSFQDGKWCFYCDAKNKKHAIKIANEKRAYLIASDAWEAKEGI